MMQTVNRIAAYDTAEQPSPQKLALREYHTRGLKEAHGAEKSASGQKALHVYHLDKECLNEGENIVDYVNSVLGTSYQKTYVYDLIQAGEIQARHSAAAESPVSINERTARVLKKYTPEAQQAIIADLVDRGENPSTASVIQSLSRVVSKLPPQIQKVERNQEESRLRKEDAKERAKEAREARANRFDKGERYIRDAVADGTAKERAGWKVRILALANECDAA